MTLEVLFAQVPFYNLTHPSLGPSILKTCLENAGISASIQYYGLRFAEKIGLSEYYGLLDSKCDQLRGDWIFADAAFGEGFRLNCELELGSSYPWITQELVELSQISISWIEEIANDVVQQGPKILVCSSMFQQNLASLALLKAVKKLDPSILTVMGGPNVEGMLGIALLRRSKYLDYVSTGEGEQSLVSLCSSLLNASSCISNDLPVGVYSQASLPRFKGMFTENLPRATVNVMQESPFPDFSDYFDQIKTSGLDIEPGLLLESSRGCWWGQKKQCTFCGLNSTSMVHRARPASQTGQMVSRLTSKFNVNRVFFVDNIMPKEYVSDLLPFLSNKNLVLFYEVKADLVEADFKSMRDAGVRFLQPGIESLSTELLCLMQKGSSALLNIECLRLCREYGIRPTWSLLFGFPGEDCSNYDEMASLMPSLFHLRPPNGLFPIRYDRFSAYFYDPKRWGLELKASSAYKYIYPDYLGSYEDIAYYFQDTSAGGSELGHLCNSTSLQSCNEVVQQWQKAWIIDPCEAEPLPTLKMVYDDSGTWVVLDTRFGELESSQIDEAMAALLLYCRHRRSRADLNKFSRSTFVSRLDSLDDLLRQAISRRWIISGDGMWLTLVMMLDADQPSLSMWPGGCYRGDRKEAFQNF